MAEGIELMSREIIDRLEVNIEARVQQLHEGGCLPTLLIATDNYDHKPTRDYMNLKDKVP